VGGSLYRGKLGEQDKWRDIGDSIANSIQKKNSDELIKNLQRARLENYYYFRYQAKT